MAELVDTNLEPIDFETHEEFIEYTVQVAEWIYESIHGEPLEIDPEEPVLPS